MRRMLERDMDDDTKTHLLERVNDMELTGLAYKQHGLSYQNPHYDMSFVLKNLNFDEFRQLQTMVGQNIAKINNATADNYTTLAFTATEYEQLKKELALHTSVWNWMLSCLVSFQILGYLTYPVFFISSFFITSFAKAIGDKLQFDFHSLISALETYMKNYDRLGCHEQGMAWLDVGKAQRDVPAHIAHEYCRPDRSFYPLPSFTEEHLPRNIDLLTSLDKLIAYLEKNTIGIKSEILMSLKWARHDVENSKGMTNLEESIKLLQDTNIGYRTWLWVASIYDESAAKTRCANLLTDLTTKMSIKPP